METTPEPRGELIDGQVPERQHAIWEAQRCITRSGDPSGIGAYELQQLPEYAIAFIEWMTDGRGNEDREALGASHIVRKFLLRSSMDSHERGLLERWYDEWMTRKQSS